MGTKLGFEDSLRGLDESKRNGYGQIVNSINRNGGLKRDRYNFSKYGEKPYLPELERRSNQEFISEPYDPDYKLFIKAMIDDIIGLHKPVSGYILKLIFDEYQRGKTSTDIYTNFYTNYIGGKNDSTHCNIANNNLYLLFINTWNDIIPRRVLKESDIVLPILQSLSGETKLPEKEIFAREIAIRIHNKVPGDDWREEMVDNIHLWDKPIHIKYLLIAKDIISWNIFNKEAEDEEE